MQPIRTRLNHPACLGVASRGMIAAMKALAVVLAVSTALLAACSKPQDIAGVYVLDNKDRISTRVVLLFTLDLRQDGGAVFNSEVAMADGITLGTRAVGTWQKIGGEVVFESTSSTSISGSRIVPTVEKQEEGKTMRFSVQKNGDLIEKTDDSKGGGARYIKQLK